MVFWKSRGRHKRLAFAATFVAVLAAALGIAGLSFRGQGAASALASDGPESTGQKLIRTGDQIFVPELSPMRSQLVVQVVDTHETARSLAVPASVEADPARTVNILPPVTGKVVELKARLGDHVTKGQALLVLASGDLAQAQADAGKARDAMQLSKRALERARQVLEAGGSADKDLEQAESSYTQALEEYQRTEQRLVSLGGSARIGDKTALLTLTSPIAGYVTALSIAPGAFVNDATASVMTIANLDSIWVTANVPENLVSLVAKGQMVSITLPAYPGEAFQGAVAFVSAVLDPDTRSDKVRIALDNRAGKFKPNMFANTNFAIPQTRQIFAPNSALLMNNDSVTVLVEVQPWTYMRRTVELGYEEASRTLIRHGLNQGERIIVQGGVLLND